MGHCDPWGFPFSGVVVFLRWAQFNGSLWTRYWPLFFLLNGKTLIINYVEHLTGQPLTAFPDPPFAYSLCTF